MASFIIIGLVLGFAFVMIRRARQAVDSESGGLVFRILYLLYTRTYFGQYYHNRNIAKAKLKYSDFENGAHSIMKPHVFGKIRISPIPYCDDNYCYAIVHSETNDVVLVDVGDFGAVQKYLTEHMLIPRAVLTTHKHWDHSGGNGDVKKHFPSVPIYGSRVDAPPGVSEFVKNNEVIKAGVLHFDALMTPGHTTGHTVYVLRGSDHSVPDMVFSGDLLFIMGCGKNFEGTSAEMVQSLDIVCALGPETLVWPGHEYTKSNAQFLCSLDPQNEGYQDKLEEICKLREDRLPTVPSTIKDELKLNVFLRTHESGIAQLLGQNIPEQTDLGYRASIFNIIRTKKNAFKPV